MTKEFVGYAFQKTLATGFIDMALLLANVSQLKILTEQELSTPNFKTVVAILLVVLSIMLQVAVGCILIYLGKEENKAMSKIIVVTDSSDNISENSGKSTGTADTTDMRIINVEIKAQTENKLQSFIPEIYEIKNEALSSEPKTTGFHQISKQSNSEPKTTVFHQINEKINSEENTTENKQKNSEKCMNCETRKGSQDGLDEVDAFYVINGESNIIRAVRGPSPTPSRRSPTSRHSPTDSLDRIKDIESGAVRVGENDHIGDLHKKHSNTNAHVMCCVFIIMIINIVLSGMGLGLSDGQTMSAILNGTNS